MMKRWYSVLLSLCGLPMMLAAEAGRANSAAIARSMTDPKVRRFHLVYEATVKDLSPRDGVVRVWIPLATSDANQTVKVTKVGSPVAVRVTQEQQYGNRMLYAEMRHPEASSATFRLEFEVTRREYSRGGYAELVRFDRRPRIERVSLRRFLQPDRLVPIDGKMKELAEENTRGKEGTVEKAYALYDYVFRTLRYDKSGTGWGRGDSLWACDAKRGNCTDFHSLFISMMRAEGIPARFEIGLPLPPTSPDGEGEIPGYHCWAEFYLNGLGWVPVDISEAWKNPTKHDYFFGTVDANRVQFTIGRDLTLEPKQDGPPLNYFIYPYVEVDGKVHEAVDRKFSFRLEPAQHAVAP
jgi:transglutaminase-like putative cysteine protease